MNTRTSLLICAGLLSLGCASSPEQAESPTPPSVEQVVQSYAELVSGSYDKSLEDAKALEVSIAAFLKSPSDETLASAKSAWLEARKSYGVTEAYRFYEGPIDFVNEAAGEEGPEGRLNAWPLNEAYIDYVKGDPKTGLVQDTKTPLTEDLLIARNATSDEANVTTGWHAIEFLLWGQDHSAEGPGVRPASDYSGQDEVSQRRRTYLKLVTALLVSDLEGLSAAWKPGQKNYRAEFEQGGDASLGHVLTGIATLAGFELASERIAVPLDSNDQEDEHSCFSDNTHDDFLRNVMGIQQVWSAGLSELVATRDGELAKSLGADIAEALQLCRDLQPPVDRILASPTGSPLRQPLESLVTALQRVAKSLQRVGKLLGVQVVIAGE